MDAFHTYKNDWNYPITTKNPHNSSGTLLGKCVKFQEVIKVTLITGQCFGLNPVVGVCEPDASKLRFSFRSWRFFYTVTSIAIQCFGWLLCFMKMFIQNDASLGTNSNIVFYLTNSCTTILFLRIAMKWPELCVQIAKTEAADPNMDTGLTRKCNMSCLIILILALVEHTLSNISTVSIILECDADVNIFRGYVARSFPWVWTFLPFNYFFAVISLLTNVQCTFNWNFADLFVICISLYLSSRLDQVNIRINSVKDKSVPSSYWRTMREDYNRITSLVRVVDDIIGGVVFISFANNLFFICFQLLHTLADGIKSSPRCRADEPDIRPLRGYEHAVYFVFSLSFLVLRSFAVSMAASKVHTSSKAPATALYDVSSSTYCIEIRRFLDQIHGDAVSMSGLQFFQVKRGVILSILWQSSLELRNQILKYGTSLLRFQSVFILLSSNQAPRKLICIIALKLMSELLRGNSHSLLEIAGTIVTYELVLMQFTGISPSSSPV